jgi:sigma-B regulation protein RsbU (phosphoserine phosphatase)
VAAYLYLDARSRHAVPAPSRLRPSASAFCAALGRMASLALANLKRLDIEHRQALMEAELSAAAAAQRWILPRRQTRAAGFDCTGESRPGAYVGGDFFDLIELGPTRLAVALGDVTGHGVAASVLMTATQGFLHAALQEHGDVARAVTALNAFVHPRRSDDRFVTLWVGVFDAAARTLTYVDAGHGYAMMLGPEPGAFTPLIAGDGLPVGILDDGGYTAQTVPLAAGARALVTSDGIPEQYGVVRGPDGTTRTEHFEMAGIRRAITSTPPDRDPVAVLFDAVVRHAGTTTLQDDATAVLIRW